MLTGMAPVATKSRSAPRTEMAASAVRHPKLVSTPRKRCSNPKIGRAEQVRPKTLRCNDTAWRAILGETWAYLVFFLA